MTFEEHWEKFLDIEKSKTTDRVLQPFEHTQPQGEPLGLQPRHSGRDRRPVICPDNVYGSRNPTQSEQMSNQEFRKITEGVPALSRASGNRPNSPPGE